MQLLQLTFDVSTQNICLEKTYGLYAMLKVETLEKFLNHERCVFNNLLIH